MTCIIAFTPDDRSVYMAADKRTSSGTEYTDGTEKLVAHQHMLMACAGDRRLSNLLANLNVEGLDVPKRANQYDAFLLKLVDRIAEKTDEQKYSVIREAARSLPSCEIIVGLPGYLYTISWDFAITEVGWRYWTAGSGGDYARGWFHHWFAHARQINPDKIQAALADAIKAASEFDSGTSRTCSFASRGMPLL